MSFVVHHPASVADALALARQFGASGRFIAGGTDLIIQINRHRVAPQHLVALQGLRELAGIEVGAEEIRLGALTTHKEIERHRAFEGELAALAESARVVGGHQVRNMGTVGGNIANASPAADVVAALLALDAEVSLRGPEGERALALSDFLLGPGRTVRRDDEIVQSVRIARPAAASGSAFLKAGRRKAMEISVVCVAAALRLQGGRCAEARITLGAVNATAMRARAAEAALAGAPATEETFRAAGQLAAEACQPISDVRASARYRRLLVEALVPRALALAARRAAGGSA